jgi:hypothetical protein
MARRVEIRLVFANQTLDNLDVRKTRKPRITTKEAHEAAVVLGTSSWQARTERFTPQQLSVQLSIAGKLGGRPRKVRT